MKTNITLFLFGLSILFNSCNSNSQKEILKPFSREELKELGITMNDTGLFYKNYLKNDQFVEGHFIGKNDNQAIMLYSKDSILNDTNPSLTIERKYFNKMNPSYNNFYPQIISDTLGNIAFSTSKNGEKPKLFPVEITGLDMKLIWGKNGIIFWFNVTNDFLKKLPERFKNLKNYNYKKWTLKEIKEKTLIDSSI